MPGETLTRVITPAAATAGWWDRYRCRMQEELSSTSVEVVDLDTEYVTATGVFGAGDPRVEPERWPQNRLRRGLVIGSVQSGKTASMLGVAAKSLDRGVSVVVLLGGTRVALWRQTAERVIEHLDQWSHGADSTHRLRRILIPEPILLHGALELPGLDDLYHAHPNRVIRALKKGRPLIAVVMKQGDHIGRLVANLHGVLTALLTQVEGAVHLLVVDDEADDGSILDARQEAALPPDSTMYKSLPRHIARLWAGPGPLHCTHHPRLFATYLAYTATPQSNLLQWTHNPLSPTHFVAALRYPLDRGSVVPPRVSSYREPSGLSHYYTGGEVFYERMPWGNHGLCVPYDYPDEDDFEAAEEFGRAVEDLRAQMLGPAIRAFMVACAMRMLSSNRRISTAWRAAPGTERAIAELSPPPCTMLVHPSASKEGHLHAARAIAAWSAGYEGDEPELGDYVVDAAGRPAINEVGLTARLAAEEELWRSWLDDYNATAANLTREFGGAGADSMDGSRWEEVKSILVHEVFPAIRVRVINSDPMADDRPGFVPQQLDRSSYGPAADLLSIFVSGNVMARGITLEGLVTTLFVRSSDEPAADTQMQMQRWFGYRGRILQYCRVFLYSDQLHLFRAYHENDEALRGEVLHEMNTRGSTPVPPLVLQGDGYKATAKIANLGALPLCPGPRPFVRVVETANSGANCQVLAELLAQTGWGDLEVAGTLRGKLWDRQLSLVEVAAVLESLRYSHHDPAGDAIVNGRWQSIADQMGLERDVAPLFRAPGVLGRDLSCVGPEACPFTIAAYLRLWAACLTRQARGLYPTDDHRTPWSMINLSEYAALAPRFWVGVRYGDAGESRTPGLSQHGIRCMERQIEDGRLVGTWGSRNPGRGEGAYLGDHLFDYHHTHLHPPEEIPGEASWRPRGHPGLLLFHVIRSRGLETLAIGLGLPLGGPDHFAAFVPAARPGVNT